MTAPLSVTVLAGSAGIDASRSLEQLLQTSNALRVAAIVPKRGKKRNRTSSSATIIPTTENLVRLGKGCSCCTVRGDLMAKIQRLADEQNTDHIVIQAAAHDDLHTLAKTFTVANDSGAVLSNVARIEHLVTVIDATQFFATFETDRVRAMLERIELANTILLEGTAGQASERIERVLVAIRALNAGAQIVLADENDVGLAAFESNAPFDLDMAPVRAAGSADPTLHPEEDSAVVKFSYSARRPFHPGRLHALLQEPWPGVLRAQGTFWVATRPDYVCELDIAGASRSTSSEGMWWATVPSSERPNNPALTQYLESIWDEQFGDRHQALRIIGIESDESELRTRLDSCLLTAEELADAAQWPLMDDPFQWPPTSV